MTIRVFLVEDHRMVREALCEVLQKELDIEVVGEAGDARDALEQVRQLRPDVVVSDILTLAPALAGRGFSYSKSVFAPGCCFKSVGPTRRGDCCL